MADIAKLSVGREEYYTRELATDHEQYLSGHGESPDRWAQIEHYRHTYHITDPDRALGPEPHDPGQRAARQRTRTAIERVQAKQRAADHSRDAQPTTKRINQPRPHQQRGRAGPERAAG